MGRKLGATPPFGKAEPTLFMVVPADAGTHNHRTLWLPTAVRHHASKLRRGVWVPAFAGTTRSSLQHRSPDGATRNPGICRSDARAPDFASLHPGYCFIRLTGYPPKQKPGRAARALSAIDGIDQAAGL
jgi:hypothetical protein